MRLAFVLSVLIHAVVIGVGHPPRLSEADRTLIVFIRPTGKVGDSTLAGAPGKPQSPRVPSQGQRPPLLTAAAGSATPLQLPAPVSPADEAGGPARGDLPRAPEVGSDSQEGQALNPEGLRQYRVSLGGAMGGFKDYPALARQRGWQGRVELLLKVVRGRPTLAEVEKSSGYPLLDARARDMLQQAAAQTPLPPGLDHRDFALPLTVVFELEAR